MWFNLICIIFVNIYLVAFCCLVSVVSNILWLITFANFRNIETFHMKLQWWRQKFSAAIASVNTLLPCRTDGVKTLIDGFQRNFRFATFSRCFIHFKGNIQTEPYSNISSRQQKLYMPEMFGKQEGTTKFYGLVDSESTQEFDQTLEGLKNDWNNRELGITNISFFDLFK